MLALVIGGNVGGLGGPLEPLNYIHFMCTNYVPGEPEVGVGFGVQLYGLLVVVNVAGILFFLQYEDTYLRYLCTKFELPMTKDMDVVDQNMNLFPLVEKVNWYLMFLLNLKVIFSQLF